MPAPAGGRDAIERDAGEGNRPRRDRAVVAQERASGSRCWRNSPAGCSTSAAGWRPPASRSRPIACSSHRNSASTLRPAVPAISRARHHGCLPVSPSSRRRRARRHGYDVVDHATLNLELGGEAAYARLCAALARGRPRATPRLRAQPHGHRHREPLVDRRARERPVERPRALSSTSTGSRSRSELDNKVLVPVLGDQYGAVLERGELKLVRDGGRSCSGTLNTPFLYLPRRIAQLLQFDLDSLIAELGRRRPGAAGAGVASSPQLEQAAARATRRIAARSQSASARRRSPSGGWRRSARQHAPSAGTSTRTCALQRHAGRAAQLRPARHAARQPGLPARVLAGRRARRSTTAASSTSTRSPPSAWRTRACSRDAHRLVLRPARRGQARPGCASITPTASTIRRATSGGCRNCLAGGACAARWPRRPRSRRWGARGLGWSRRWWRRSRSARPRRARPLYVVAEKILARREPLPHGWAVAGTTGYDFLVAVNGLFVDAAARRALRDLRELRAGSPARRLRGAHLPEEEAGHVARRWRARSTCSPRRLNRISRDQPAHPRLHPERARAARSSSSWPASQSTAPTFAARTPRASTSATARTSSRPSPAPSGARPPRQRHRSTTSCAT